MIEKSLKRTRTINIHVYEDERLEEVAERTGFSKSEIVEWLIEECMDEFEKSIV